jgi:hypothetical protein
MGMPTGSLRDPANPIRIGPGVTLQAQTITHTVVVRSLPASLRFTHFSHVDEVPPRPEEFDARLDRPIT